MSSETEAPAPAEVEEVPVVANPAVECAGCGCRVILLPPTIQTFCYYCGLSVTRLDAKGLYYEPLTPAN